MEAAGAQRNILNIFGHALRCDDARLQLVRLHQHQRAKKETSHPTRKACDAHQQTPLGLHDSIVPDPVSGAPAVAEQAVPSLVFYRTLGAFRHACER